MSFFMRTEFLELALERVVTPEADQSLATEMFTAPCSPA